MTCYRLQGLLPCIILLALPHAQGMPGEEWRGDSDGDIGVGDRGSWANKAQVNKRVQPPPTDTEVCRECSAGLTGCLDTMGQCQCLSAARICDARQDCLYGEDEDHCLKNQCTAPLGFLCSNGKCVNKELVCDGHDDCTDNSDETVCAFPKFEMNCTSDNQFFCANGDFCISLTWVCDGDFDCHDRSDEANCSKSCSDIQHDCGDGSCIYKLWVCDGELDCSNGSDEADCPTIQERSCEEGKVMCGVAGRCVARHYLCDGENDCGDWSDEMDCGNRTTCLPKDYKCGNGQCIEAAWVCDGATDCEDGEDEAECPSPPTGEACQHGWIPCDGKCISPQWVCDGEEDCQDGADESNCQPCDAEHFSCRSGDCIAWHSLCDGHHDCLHGDDEVNCESRDCETKGCSYACSSQLDSCLCQNGYTLSSDNVTCEEVDECSLFPACSQICQNEEASFECSCVKGYSPRADGSCKAELPMPTLIFARRNDIRQITLDGQDYTAMSQSLDNVISLDYHYTRGLLFWTDITLDAIMTAYINGSHQRPIVRWGLRMPSGLAVDWINDHLYWLDGNTRRIEVAHLDGSNRRPLIWMNLHKPRALVLHPQKGFIIWTDWGANPKIERSYLDGSERQMIISDGLHWPNGITLDYPTETLYWTDAKQHVIEAAKIDGTRRRKVIETNLPHPFAITVFEDNLYWTDWQTRSIQTANKRTGKEHKDIHTSLAFPMDIRSYHPVRQPREYDGHRGCSWRNGGCSHLCLQGRQTINCYCPHGLQLQPDGASCGSRPNQVLVFAQQNNLRMVPLTNTDSINKSSRQQMDTVLPLDGVVSPLALDFLVADDLVFWTDVEAQTISRAHLNGSNQMILVRTNLEQPGGIAVDWVTQKLYWVDSGTKRIEVSNLDGSMRHLLLWKDLDKPRDIVVDPTEGLMFWSDWGNSAKIESAGMDGCCRKILIEDNIKWPNGLGIDHETSTLYWLDASTNNIEMVNLDGTNRRPLIKGELSHPFGLALWNNSVYWSDWDTYSIQAADKTTGKNRQTLVDGLKMLMDLRVFERTSQGHIDTPCDSRNGGCSHLCLLTVEGGHTCACPTGVMLKADNRKCRSSPKQSLIFARREDIRQLSLDTEYHVDVVLPLTGLQNVVALDIDPVSGDVFIPDSAQAVILRASMDGRHVTQVASQAIDTVEGIAVDATGRKVYWTDFSRQSVEVSELDGNNRLVLYTGLDRPRAIVTHYPTGLFFWTDWAADNPRIEKSDMDGKERAVLVQGDDIAWPNGLAVDWKEHELYWTDAKINAIESIAFDGSNRRKVVEGVPHPYGLTILGDWVYWTDWESKSLNRSRKINGQDTESLRQGLSSLMDIKAMPSNTSEYVGKNECGSNNGGCSHLCLRNPTGITCTCPTGLTRKTPSTCHTLPFKYLVFAAKGTLGRVSLDTQPLWDVPLKVAGVTHPIAVDFHYSKKLLFFTDMDLDAIRAVNLNNITHPWTVISGGFNTPDGLAVDWVANNLYWTDAGRKVIEVSMINGTNRMILISERLVEPRAIAVFPEKGLLFWTDWGGNNNNNNNSKIERSYLDGSERTILVNTDIGWPNGLTIDYAGERIYWNDANRDTIETSDLNGNNRAVLVRRVPRPFGLTQLGPYIYWTDWEKMSIERADKNSGTKKETIRSGIQGIMDIKAIAVDVQHGNNPCSVANGGCSHLCLFTPSGARCACPDIPTSKPCTTEAIEVDMSESAQPSHDSSLEAASHDNGFVTIVIVTIVISMVVGAAVVSIVLWWNIKKQSKMVEGSKCGSLTYTNPTYSASNSDVNTDKKPFTWRRLHHEANQTRMFEERGEVAALISEGSSVEHESPPPTPPQRPEETYDNIKNYTVSNCRKHEINV